MSIRPSNVHDVVAENIYRYIRPIICNTALPSNQTHIGGDSALQVNVFNYKQIGVIIASFKN